MDLLTQAMIRKAQAAGLTPPGNVGLPAAPQDMSPPNIGYQPGQMAGPEAASAIGQSYAPGVGAPQQSDPFNPQPFQPARNTTGSFRDRMPTPPSQVLQPSGREPGHVKRMLMDFLYGGAQALKVMVGLPTDAEVEKQQYIEGLAQAKEQRESQLVAAQMQNMQMDNQRAQMAQVQQEAERQAKLKQDAADPKNWSLEQRTDYANKVGLQGDAATKFRASGEFPSDYGTREKVDTSVTPFETASKLYGPAKAVDMFRPKGTTINTGAGAGAGVAATPGTPLKNPTWERLAQLVASPDPNTRISLDDALKTQPIKSGGKEAITLRAAELGASLKKPLDPKAQGQLRDATRAERVGQLILKDVQKHPDWVGGIASMASGGGKGGIVGKVQAATGKFGYTADQAMFRNRVTREFAVTAHELYGSAFTGTELEMARQALPNLGMSPPEFEAAIKTTLQNVQRAKDILGLQRGGISVPANQTPTTPTMQSSPQSTETDWGFKKSKKIGAP